MSRFKNYVKDLFDLRKPVTTIKGILALVGLVFILDTIYHLLTGVITGFSFFKSFSWPTIITHVINAPILEGIIFWAFFWVLLKLLESREFQKMNLLWIFVILIGLIFGFIHTSSGNPLIIAIFVKGFSGILYGWLVAKTRSLWPNILVHALWNFCAILFFY